MPCLWDEDLAIQGIPNPYKPPHDMPQGSPPDPSHAGSHIAHVADLQKAWVTADLSHGQRQSLFLRFGLDSLQMEIATDLDIEQSTVTRRLDSGIGKIRASMNGRPSNRYEEDEYDDTSDC